MSNKVFAERLNQLLDEIGAPSHQNERVDAFAKLIDLPRFRADALLGGQIPLDDALLTRIADEFEVSVPWLLGQQADR